MYLQKNKLAPISAVLIAFFVLTGFNGCMNPNLDAEIETPNFETELENETINEDEASDEEVITESEEVTSNPASGPKYVVADGDYARSLLGNEVFALFFHAGWCPTCRTMEADLKANADNLPARVVQVDYDTEKSLKTQFGITSQSTVLIFNGSGVVYKTLVNATAAQISEATQELL